MTRQRRAEYHTPVGNCIGKKNATLPEVACRQGGQFCGELSGKSYHGVSVTALHEAKEQHPRHKDFRPHRQALRALILKAPRASGSEVHSLVLSFIPFLQIRLG